MQFLPAYFGTNLATTISYPLKSDTGQSGSDDLASNSTNGGSGYDLTSYLLKSDTGQNGSDDSGIDSTNGGSGYDLTFSYLNEEYPDLSLRRQNGREDLDASNSVNTSVSDSDDDEGFSGHSTMDQLIENPGHSAAFKKMLYDL